MPVRKDQIHQYPESLPETIKGIVLDTEVKLNDRGQIVIPLKVRKALGLNTESKLKLSLAFSGEIVLQKLVQIPVDFSLEHDPALMDEVASAYRNMEDGQVGSAEKLKAFFRKK